MLQNRKSSTGGLLLAGLAAYGIYKYYKMSGQQRTDLVSGIKEKGKSILDKIVPGGMKNTFGNKEESNNFGNNMGT